MEQKILSQFGKNVRKYRRSKGWSQQTFADHVGLHRTYIGAVERGERNVSLINIVLIAKALGCTIEDLCYGLDLVEQDE